MKAPSDFDLNRVIREDDVMESTGDPRSTLRLRVKQGVMTTPVKIGPHSSGWPAREIAIINAARIEGWTQDEIRELVKRLMYERRQLVAQTEQRLAG